MPRKKTSPTTPQAPPPADATDTPAAPTTTADAAADVQAATTTAVTVTIDLAPPDPDVYLKRHVDLQLSLEQRQTLRRVFDAANTAGRRLRNGRFVQSAADAVRYLLEQIDPPPPEVAPPPDPRK